MHETLDATKVRRRPMEESKDAVTVLDAYNWYTIIPLRTL
jgi:hypothetical protein